MAGSVRITKIKFHRSAFNELRKSPEVTSNLIASGRAIADAAGGYPKFDTVVTANSSRARVIVVTADIDGMVEEATNRSLTRALDAGRG